MRRRVLIGQIACFGDCLYATTIARQLKHDDPDVHVTWAVASKYRSILDHNPHIDTIWELPIYTRDIRREDWDAFEREAESRRQQGEFDEILYTQIIDRHIDRFLTTLRNTVFDIFSRPITVPVQPVVRLTEAEVANVAAFAARHALATYRHVVLFECTPSSLQSQLNTTFALKLATEVTAKHSDVCFVLSSHEPVPARANRVFDASVLTFRENAEITKYCSLLIGCSSGITWLTTSDAAKRLPMLQLLNEESRIFCGVNFDHQLNGLDTSDIVEMTAYDLSRAVECVVTMLTAGPREAKARFDQVYRPNRFTLEHTALALSRKRDRSLTAMWRFITDYIAMNARLGNAIAVSRTRVFAKVVMSRIRSSSHPILRMARRSVRAIVRRTDAAL